MALIENPVVPEVAAGGPAAALAVASPTGALAREARALLAGTLLTTAIAAAATVVVTLALAAATIGAPLLLVALGWRYAARATRG